jgi:hypothetical protein
MEAELEEVEPIETVACCNDGLLVVDGDEEIEDDIQAVSVGVAEVVAVELKDAVCDPDAVSDDKIEGVSFVDALEDTQIVEEMLLETLTVFDAVPVPDDDWLMEAELEEV